MPDDRRKAWTYRGITIMPVIGEARCFYPRAPHSRRLTSYWQLLLGGPAKVYCGNKRDARRAIDNLKVSVTNKPPSGTRHAVASAVILPLDLAEAEQKLGAREEKDLGNGFMLRRQGVVGCILTFRGTMVVLYWADGDVWIWDENGRSRSKVERKLHYDR